MRFISVAIVITILLTGCKVKLNKDIIPGNTFKEILIDIHLADGIYMMNYGKYQQHTDSLNFYNTIFQSYGYTRAQFDSTMRYYTVNPVEFDKIYEKVVNELNILEQQITQLRNFENDSSKNLFKGKTKLELPTISKTTRIPFDIALDKDSAEYTINVYAKKFPDDQSENLRLTAWIVYTDSISKEIVKEQFPEIKYNAGKYYNLYTSTKVYTYKRPCRLRGWILNHDNEDRAFKKHLDIKTIYIEKKILARKR